jgi:hypothetical protein
MNTRTLKLHAKHEHVSTVDSGGNRNAQATTAGVRSKLIAWKPPVGTFYGVAKGLIPTLKLLQTGGAQVSGSCRLFVGKQRPGDASPVFAPGPIDMFPFVDLSTAEQRDADNRSTLAVDLGAKIVLREEEELVIYADGPEAIDPTEAGTTIEFNVDYATV